MTHTPTPWEAKGNRIIAPDYHGADPWNIAETFGAAPNSAGGSENAEFIVTAVNAHDDMLEALETVYKNWDGEPEDMIPVCAAITQARGASMTGKWRSAREQREHRLSDIESRIRVLEQLIRALQEQVRAGKEPRA